jgi:hypothetical protein
MGYLSYWSLRGKPFVAPDPSLFFAGVPQREAIAGLSYFVNSRVKSAFLVAPRGCGTTRLLKYAMQMQGFGDCAVESIVTDGQSERGDIRVDLIRALGYRSGGEDVREELGRALRTGDTGSVKTVWFIDRCQRPAASLAGRLVADHPNLSVVIATSPDEFGKRVVDVGRFGMRVDLTPLSLGDTVDYLQYCVQHAGGRESLFSDNAAVRLHELTGGVLGPLAVLAESSLVLAASHSMDQVGPAVIEATSDQIAYAA